MTRFALAAAAMLVALAPALALDGEPGMHDPSTVIVENGKVLGQAGRGKLLKRKRFTVM